MKLMRRVVVFDAADLATESAFWAGMLDGRVLPDDTWHSVFDADGRWVIGVQLAPDHDPPDWPDGNPQQVHLDLHIDNPASAHATAIALGARLLRAADDLTAAEGHQVYADPAGHPFCLGWGHPDDGTIRRILSDHASPAGPPSDAGGSGLVTPSWPEATGRLTSGFVVGDTGFEPVTSAV